MVIIFIERYLSLYRFYMDDYEEFFVFFYWNNTICVIMFKH